MKEIVIYSASNKDPGSISIKVLPKAFGVTPSNLRSIKIDVDNVLRSVNRAVVTNVGGMRIWCKGTGSLPIYNKLAKIHLYIEE